MFGKGSRQGRGRWSVPVGLRGCLTQCLVLVFLHAWSSGVGSCGFMCVHAHPGVGSCSVCVPQQLHSCGLLEHTAFGAATPQLRHNALAALSVLSPLARSAVAAGCTVCVLLLPPSLP